MANSAAAFAAALTEDLHRDMPGCVMAASSGFTPIAPACGDQAGPVVATCASGHVSTTYLCAHHVAAVRRRGCCTPCAQLDIWNVPVTITTEVA